MFWISAGLGLALALAGIGLAGPLADFYGEPAVRPLFAAVSIGFLVSALGTTHMALLAREMNFRRLELRQIVATLVGAVVGITVALKGFGAWAIVGQQLAEATASTVLLWCLLRWRPSLRLSTASLGRLGGFAGNVFGENLLYQAGRSLGDAAHRPLPHRSRGGRLCACDERHPRAVRQARRAAAAGLLPGVLAHGRRPRAHRRRLDPCEPASRRSHDPGARRARHRRARTSCTSSSAASGAPRLR